jgi:hypothetical protein
VVFLLIEFPLHQQKSLCLLLSAVFIFVDTLRTHLSFYLEVKFQFSIINLVLPFIFSNGERLWDWRFDKYSLGSRGSVSGRSYILETSLVSWALLNGQHECQFFINDSF